MPFIDLTALTHTNTHTFLPERLYTVFFSFLFLHFYGVFLGIQNHISTFKNSQAALKTMKLTLSASSFKASGLKGRLPSKQLHSAENKMYCVRKPNWHCLERVQWGCSAAEPKQASSSCNKNWENPSPAPWLSLWIKFIVLVVARSQDIFNQCLSLVLVEGRKISLRGHSCRRTSRQRRL